MTERTLTRLGRTFDGIAYGILGTLFILCHPRLGVTPLGALGNLHVAPVFGVVVATFVLPVPRNASEAWRTTSDRLRLAALVAMGLLPFVSWWLRAGENLYLMICGSAGVFAAIWYLLELLNLLISVFRSCGCTRLVLEGRIARILALYVVLIPVLAVYVAFVAGTLIFPGVLLSDLYDTWLLIPLSLRCLMTLPVLQICWLLWRGHRAILEQIPENSALRANRSPAANDGKEP